MQVFWHSLSLQWEMWIFSLISLYIVGVLKFSFIILAYMFCVRPASFLNCNASNPSEERQLVKLMWVSAEFVYAGVFPISEEKRKLWSFPFRNIPMDRPGIVIDLVGVLLFTCTSQLLLTFLHSAETAEIWDVCSSLTLGSSFTQDNKI